MTSSLSVNPEDVNNHATAVAALGERVGTAAAAAAHLSGLDDAYGVFGRPFVANLAQDAQEPAARALEDVATGLDTLAQKLRQVAEGFAEIDKRNSTDLEKKAEDLKRAEEPHRPATDHSDGGTR